MKIVTRTSEIPGARAYVIWDDGLNARSENARLAMTRYIIPVEEGDDVDRVKGLIDPEFEQNFVRVEGESVFSADVALSDMYSATLVFDNDPEAPLTVDFQFRVLSVDEMAQLNVRH
jgi:hypothetical protein